MTEPTKVATNDRGTLYDACLTQQINVGMDAAVNASDYSIGTWMEYFDSDPADSISIDYQDSQDAMLGLILKMLYQWLPKGQVVDPDLQSYGDNWDLFDHTRFLSSGTTASSFTFTSDPAINGAGGLFYAMAFVKKFKDTLTVKKAPVEVRTPGYPYGYATGAKANYTFYGEKDQVLRLCIEDYGSTFSGLDTNRGSLLIYAGADASPSNFIRSFETENDMQYGCAYTYTPGDPMFVVFRVPETIVTKTITLGSLTLPPITVPIFIGGRVTSDSQSHSLGFRFSVSNVAPMAPPTVTDSAPSLSTSFFSLILAAGFVFFML
uniref:Peptidase A1 domain-containing protein n=1 Tax=Steinernema glaseri TaxID=37863 RepID=A0A1I7Z2Q8_9BILA